MTPDEKRMLEETLEVARENAKILKNLQRGHRIGVVFRVLYWGVIIAASVGAYYFIEPYINVLKGAYTNLGLF